MFFKSKWIDVKTFQSSTTVDNRQSSYYVKNGFHPYDTMCDIETDECILIVQQHKKTKETRIKQVSNYFDLNLYNQATKFKDTITID